MIALGLAWRAVRYALAFPLWGDEAFVAVNFLVRDFVTINGPLEFAQVAPPGFLWAELAAVRVLGASEWSLRLLPFLAGVASLLLFRRFCRDVTSPRVTLLAVAVLAGSYYPVRHANEVKHYAIDLFVSLVLSWLGWRVARRPDRPGLRSALVAAGVAGVWCSYTAVFPISAVSMFLASRGLAGRSRTLVATATAFAAFSAASWATMMATVGRSQLPEASWLSVLETWRGAFPPISQPWRLPWWLLETHAGNMMAYPLGGKNFASAATFLLAIVGAVAVWRRKARRPLLLLLLGPIPAALVAASMHRYPYGGSARTMLYLAPAFCLLAAEGFAFLQRLTRTASWGAQLIAGLLALISVVGLVGDVAAPYASPADVKFRREAQRLAAMAEPGDRWVAFDGATPLPRYPALMLSPWVQRVARFRFYLLLHAPVPVMWEPDPGAIIPTSTGRTWLIIHDHGFCLYPRGREEQYKAVLERRLGPPRATWRPIDQGSTLGVLVYDPPGR